MKLNIPENFTPDVALIEAQLPTAQSNIDAWKAAGFESSDINRVVENTCAVDLNLALACASLVESMTIQEVIVKHVDSRGTITKTKDRETRKRNAFQTTGLSKAKRRQIARKAVKTKAANPSIGVHAQRKTKKALKKRKAMGLS